MTGSLRMTAAVLRDFGQVQHTEEVILDPPGQGEVLVKVGAAGVCHSDLRLAEGSLGHKRIPIILGHEGSGVVVALGEGVTHVKPGDHVAFCIIPACGTCRFCRQRTPTLCEVAGENGGRGLLMDGTSRLHLASGEPLKHFLFVSCFAEYAVVPAASAIPIPASLPLWQAALLGCAVITGAGAVWNVARVQRGDSVCVIGSGGVGLQIIKAAQLAGAGRIIAVDRSDEKLERARSHGATDVVDSSLPEPAARVRELSDGGVDHAIEAVGIAATIRLAWDVLRPGGSAVVVGLAPVGLEVAIPAIEFLSAKNLKGCYYGSGNPAEELPELAEMAASGRFPLADSVSHFTDLDGIDDAFQRMNQSVGARTVIVIDKTIAGAP